MKAALEPCDKAPAQDQQVLDALEPHAASAPSQWTCPYCGHVEETNHENWQRCAADHIDHCPVVVGAASAPSLEQEKQERLGPPFNCHHEFNIAAWHRHERVGTHCHKCGAFRPKEFEAASAPSRPLGAAEQLKYEFDRAERLKRPKRKPRR